MFSIRHSALAGACLCLHACGGGGAGNGSSGTGLASYGRIALLSHEPVDAAVQVELDSAVTLRFDSAMVLDCMQDDDTFLRVVGTSTDVAGGFTLREAGRAVVFTPSAPLLPETDYVFQVSPLCCDQAGRLLETTQSFTFRTLDATPPTVVSANVVPGETGRSRTAPLVVTLSEAVSGASVTPTSVVLRDAFGQRLPAARTVSGATVTVTPLADLPGDRQLTLQVAAAVCDRAGNELGQTWSVSFRTQTDVGPPAAISLWPPDASTGVSPAVQPIVAFDESMDPATVEPSSLLFQDEFGSILAFAVHSSPDQKTLRVRPLQPLQPHRRYLLAFLVSAAAVTDVSGNGLAATLALSFTTGADATPPALLSVDPPAGSLRVSLNATPTITFDEALDPLWVDDTTVQLECDGVPVAAVIEQPSAAVLRVLPVLMLEPQGSYVLRLRSGHAGLRDLAGNVLAADIAVPFAATEDPTLPGALMHPPDGAVAVPPAARASIVFDSQLDPSSVSPSTCELRDDAGTPLPATLLLQGGGRVVSLVPDQALVPGAYYRTFVRGGPSGVRELSGNWLGDDLRARFRIGFAADTAPPLVAATINALDATRRAGILVPPSGFSIDVTVSDGTQVPDMGSIAVELTGPGAAPTPDQLFAAAAVGFRTWHAMVPGDLPLLPGAWTATVRARDLSGNVGTAPPIAFTVVAPNSGLVPFERTQVVWARSDLDRDGNGVPDFDDDQLRLGLATAGDALGTNAYVRRLMLEAILAQANTLYGRGARGEPLDADSVAIRFTTRQPIALPHLQIALGGLDPESPRNRRYGDPSSGVLGRAFYDYRNGNSNDRNIATSPGLGVFPAEMFLFQARLHEQLYPSFQTLFARRFLPLCPDMGGVPAGSHSVDGSVLRPAFDPGAATSEQHARWLVVMHAIDDWALVIGTVLAHEVGHSVGLVAPGPAPSGLFGDGTLHDVNSSAAEVMAPAVGYEAMVTLTYGFRDINLAYLRHRILLR